MVRKYLSDSLFIIFIPFYFRFVLGFSDDTLNGEERNSMVPVVRERPKVKEVNHGFSNRGL